MEYWIPVFVAGAWPIVALLAFLVAIFYLPIKSILRTVDERIRKGAAFKIPYVISMDANTNIERFPAAVRSSPDHSTNSSSTPVESIEPAAAVFRGLHLEIRLNEEIAESMHGDLSNLLRGTGLIPLRRLNENATAGFMQRPIVAFDDPSISLSWVYLQEIRILNRLVDSIDNPSAPAGYATARINQALEMRDRLKKSGSELLTAVSAKTPSA